MKSTDTGTGTIRYCVIIQLVVLYVDESIQWY